LEVSNVLRATLLSLTLASIPMFAQTSPAIQERVAAQQNLIRVLRSDLERYKPEHPQVRESRALISVLEEQSRLLQQPAEQWQPDAVQQQVKAITLQLGILRNQTANYKPSHPDMIRSRAIIDLLEADLRDLQRR
jgi:hypothetical protein